MHVFDRQMDRQTEFSSYVRPCLHSMQRSNKIVNNTIYYNGAPLLGKDAQQHTTLVLCETSVTHETDRS